MVCKLRLINEVSKVPFRQSSNIISKIAHKLLVFRRMQKQTPTIRILIPLVIIWVFFVVAFFFSEKIWGLGYIRSLGYGGSILLIISGSLLGVSFFTPTKHATPTQSKSTFLRQYLLPIIILGVAYTLLPIAKDVYGDAPYIIKELSITIPDWDSRLLTDLLYFHPADSKIGTTSVYALCNITAFTFGITGVEALRIWSTLFGLLFTGCWIFFIHKNIKHPSWRTVWVLAGITAPWTLMFAGHYEIYGPSFFLHSLFFLNLSSYFRSPSNKKLWIQAFLFIVCLKFHITSYLLGISFAGMVFYHYQYKKKGLISWNWNMVLYRVLLPAFGAGVVLYVFVFNSINGTRDYNANTLNEVLFIPLMSSESAPLNRYNLFSINHILDYVNLVLTWSPLGIALLAGVALRFRQKINWSNPLVIIMGLQAIVYAGAFFVLNPLLGMQADWDLFSLPAISVMALGVFLTKEIENQALNLNLIPAGIGIALLSISTLYVHSQKDMLAEVYETHGLGKFKTYWIGSSTLLHEAAHLQKSPEAAQKKRLDILTKLLPYATPNHDIEYADLLVEAGKYYFDKKDYNQAIGYFEKAFDYAPELIRNTYLLVITQFSRKEFKAAHQYGKRLIAYKHPSQKKAFRIAIHVAVEAEAYEDALVFCNDYLKLFPEDDFIQRVRKRLADKDELERIRLMFRARE